MRARLITLLFILVFSSASYAADWFRALDVLRPSTIQLWCQEHEMPLCTAFSINRTEGYFLTADHCAEGETIVAGQEAATVILRRADLDIAVLRFTTIKRPALTPRTGTLAVGEPVAGYGFAYGFPTPLFRQMVVSGFLQRGGDWVGLDKAFIGGMSGGAVVDTRGRVVGMVQQGDQQTAWTRTMKDIYAATAVYWESSR